MRLRRLITQSRPVHAGDWRRAADASQASPGDPTGCATGSPQLEHFTDLTSRVTAARSELEAARAALTGALAAIGPLRTALDQDASTIGNRAWTGKLEDLRRALFGLVPFGIPEAVPVDGLTTTAVVVDRLMRQAAVVLEIAEGRLQGAADLLATTFTDPLPADDPERTAEVERRNDLLRQSRLDAARTLLGPVRDAAAVPIHTRPDVEVAIAGAPPVAVPPSRTGCSRCRASSHGFRPGGRWPRRWIGRPVASRASRSFRFAPAPRGLAVRSVTRSGPAVAVRRRLRERRRRAPAGGR